MSSERYNIIRPLVRLFDFMAPFISSVAIVFALATIAPFFFSTLKNLDNTIDNADKVNRAFEEQSNEIISKYNDISNRIDNLLSKVENLPDNDRTKVLIVDINNSVVELKSKIKNMEDIIISNPAKAMELVILNKDIEHIKQRIDEKFQEQSDNIQQLYNMFSWSVGALVIAVAAQIISGFFHRRRV
ncbi:hypothetical protein [Ancylobacter sp. SL191]|uniref:hypothetical protein n=1 Tax=Ancylobacter sp. SL191 TaxID=2995166 RepID=UPI0022712005|nr:hypothetical protein [Ancylobacter sp. SL191]WAC28049.1 hypothetical protein OU996_02990 [Ancylobacter sp. SL191]